jgi:hypothetical protein
MINMEQSPIGRLESIVKSMISNGGDLGEDYPALLNHIEITKQKELELFNLLSDFEVWKEWKNNNFIIKELEDKNF